ncbi:MAG: hypothetical protein ACRD2W_08855 [Acidimicrobiales bacterium]
MDEQRRREVLRLAGAIAIVVVLIAFVVDNSRQVTVGFVVTERRVALIWVLVVTAVLGAVADRLLRTVWRRRRR